MTYIIIGAIVLALVVFVWFTYNSLVTLRNRVSESWSGIDVQLKRRSSLIPNLIESVKGYASHEREVFERVTEARSALMSADTPHQKAEADNTLSGTLKSLFAVAEAYPQLRANENFLGLQRDLADTEDKIAYARQFYNSNVLQYNTKIELFPSVIIANSFGFKNSEFFETDEAGRQEVTVAFDDKSVAAINK